MQSPPLKSAARSLAYEATKFSRDMPWWRDLIPEIPSVHRSAIRKNAPGGPESSQKHVHVVYAGALELEA